MAKIDQITVVKDQTKINDSRHTQKTVDQDKLEGKFKHEIEDSLKKMEGITHKIRGSIILNNDKLKTKDIIEDVKQARLILDEISNTFSLIKKTNDNTSITNNVKNATQGIKQYSDASKLIDNTANNKTSKDS